MRMGFSRKRTPREETNQALEIEDRSYQEPPEVAISEMSDPRDTRDLLQPREKYILRDLDTLLALEQTKVLEEVANGTLNVSEWEAVGKLKFAEVLSVYAKHISEPYVFGSINANTHNTYLQRYEKAVSTPHQEQGIDINALAKKASGFKAYKQALNYVIALTHQNHTATTIYDGQEAVSLSRAILFTLKNPQFAPGVQITHNKTLSVRRGRDLDRVYDIDRLSLDWQLDTFGKAPKSIQDAVAVMALTGCRPEELSGQNGRCGVVVSKIENGLSFEIENAKNGGRRYIETDLSNPMAKHLYERPHDVFNVIKNPSAIREAFRRGRESGWCDELIVPYSYRYAMAQSMSQEGWSRDDIKDVLGHFAKDSQEYYVKRRKARVTAFTPTYARSYR